MRQDKGSLLFLLYIGCAAAFVWFTGLNMPSVVASHFGTGGIPNGYMSRTSYLGFMVAFVIGLPTLMVFVTRHAMHNSKARINLPNGAYWLAPERRAETVAFLRAGVLWFGILLVAFLCYAHWLVVRANSAQPIHLAESWFTGGLVTFFIAVIIWLKAFLGHFRQGP